MFDDALGQLLTETHNGTVVNRMEYDNYGNILRKNNQWYTYGDEVWKDKLTAVGEKTITYDAQGNPTSYLGHTLTWEKGRQLKSFDGNTYTYNANGIRTSKTINGVKHTYTLDGTKILRETWGNEQIIPLYDNEDSICGLIYGRKSSPEDAGYVEESFFFLKNLQGDIIAITDQNGRVLAKYAYDAWGKCTIVEDTSECGIATVNPFRYRSYYYDSEIGMYYLQSRYYDPVCAQWINSDNIMCCGIGGKPASFNLFCNCNNNGATYADCSGFMPVSTLRMVSTIYSSGVVGAQVASMSVLALNGLGIYTAFHEIAQINIAKKLGSKGFRDIVLEYGIPGKGEADIVARRGWKRYVWEVKPIFGNASKQLEKYTNRTGLIRGYSIGTISNITIYGQLKMKITFDSVGGAYYAFYVRGRRVTNVELYKAIRAVILAACAVATAIIVATIIEDIATAGLGIWNDAMSLAGAAASMGPIIASGLRVCGFA